MIIRIISFGPLIEKFKQRDNRLYFFHNQLSRISVTIHDAKLTCILYRLSVCLSVCLSRTWIGLDKFTELAWILFHTKRLFHFVFLLYLNLEFCDLCNAALCNVALSE